ncbi:MAG: hypothetical protein PHO09_08110 [Sphaerochaeta sp.]|nr:hypothetical protein [Sphaerochaeta sp.]
MRTLRMSLSVLFIALGLAGLSASPLSFSTIELRGEMPVTEVFRVDQNEEALNFNLAESRNSIVRVGSYTLTSNNAIGQFHLYINPGEDGSQEQFAFALDDNEAGGSGKMTTIPISVRVTTNTSGAVSVKGETAMDKSLGVRGVYAGNSNVLYETGDILAEIPDFDPDLYASGWYSAAIQLSIQVL